MGRIAVLGEVVIDRIITKTSKKNIAGGSAANCALALARKGDDVKFRARFSSDKNGTFLYQEALKNELDLTYSVRAQEPATLVEVILDENGSPSYHFYLDQTADWHWTESELAQLDLATQDAFVYGSLAAIFEPNYSNLQNWLNAYNDSEVLIAYDPNARPSAVAPDQHQIMKDRIKTLVSKADVVKVSDEDISWIEPNANPQLIASSWSELGPELVVLTRGANGASAYRNGVCIADVPGVQTQVADTVGAGDTLMAWLISDLVNTPKGHRFEKSTIEKILNRAVSAAAITCSRVGCNPPTAGEIN